MKKFLLFLVVLAFPITLFAKGEIVGYLPDYRPAPTTEQLDRLTHLVLFSATPQNHNVSINGCSGTWCHDDSWVFDVSSTINRAKAKGIKVIFALGGWGKTGSFPESVKPANRTTFVNNIMNLVNQYGFDGIDIDWEYPTTPEEVTNFEGFMVALKQALGNKRLSFAIGAQYQPDKYTNATYAALDALHLMTYDSKQNNSPHHADETRMKAVLDSWVNSGRIAPEKVFFGVPFYGRPAAGDNDETYATIISSNQAAASNLDQYNGWYYDGIPTIKRKTEYAYQKNAGGIMIWEIAQDVAANNQYSLLNAIAEETKRLNGGVLGGGTPTPPVDPTRFNIPGNIDACGYSAISGGQCEGGANIGYLEDGSTVDYLINVTGGAGTYKIKMKTAEGNGNARTVTITCGAANAAIDVPAGTVNDWTTYTERQADIQLNNGNATLRISVNGAVNFKEITISKEEEPVNPTDPETPISRNKTKVITAASASVINGKLNLSLPSSAKNANIVLFDVRGRILFERDIAISGNAASVALPKHILRNQTAILQIKTNSGVNLTKRVLIK